MRQRQSLGRSIESGIWASTVLISFDNRNNERNGQQTNEERESTYDKTRQEEQGRSGWQDAQSLHQFVRQSCYNSSTRFAS